MTPYEMYLERKNRNNQNDNRPYSKYLQQVEADYYLSKKPDEYVQGLLIIAGEKLELVEKINASLIQREQKLEKVIAMIESLQETNPNSPKIKQLDDLMFNLLLKNMDQVAEKRKLEEELREITRDIIRHNKYGLKSNHNPQPGDE